MNRESETIFREAEAIPVITASEGGGTRGLGRSALGSAVGAAWIAAWSGLFGLGFSTAHAAPAPVSPGSPRDFLEITTRCPTFSWTGAPRATGFELVVVRATEENPVTDRRPALHRLLPGAASSWTPAARECLDRGERYAWFVRPIHDTPIEGGGESSTSEDVSWSEAALFEVTSHPSVEAVEEALAMIRARLADGESLADLASPSGPGGEPRAIASKSGEPTAERRAPRGDASRGTGSVAVQGSNLGTASGSTGVLGHASGGSGSTSGVVGRTDSPSGVGVRADNTAGGADLLLDGAQPTTVTESAIGVGGTTFEIGNAGNDLVLTVDGRPVVATSTPCGEGLVPRIVGGVWTCSADVDTDTTYTAGAGLVLDSTEFRVATSSCPDGAAVVGFDGSGVVCGSAGTGSLQVQAGTVSFDGFFGHTADVDASFSPVFSFPPVVSIDLLFANPVASEPASRLRSVSPAGFEAEVGLRPFRDVGENDLVDVEDVQVVAGHPAILFHSNNLLSFRRAADVSGGEWSEGQVTPIAAGIGETFGASLAIVDGNPAVSYHASGDLIYARSSNADGSGGFTPVTVADTGIVGLQSSLAVVGGRPAISFLDETEGDLLFVRSEDATGTSWPMTPVTVDASGVVVESGRATSLAVVDGRPAIAYVDVNDGLTYRRALDANGAAWDAPASLAPILATGEQYVSLAVVDGHPAVAFYHGTGAELGYVRALDSEGSSWDLATVVDDDDPVGYGASLAIVDGFPAIGYLREGGGPRYVRATDAAGASWGAPVEIDPERSAGVGSHRLLGGLAVVAGQPAVAYATSSQALRFARASDLAVHWMAMQQ